MLYLPFIIQKAVIGTVDIHSHILPRMDDGAQNSKVSLELLRMMKNQGIDKVCATPHFYPAELSLEEFLENRKNSFERIEKQAKEENLPQIILGCELFYFRNMGKSDQLKFLTLGDSSYILVELSDGPITDRVISDLSGIFTNSRLVPVIAHIERYAGQRGYRKLLKYIKNGDIPCKAQLNASSLTSKHSKRIAERLIKNGLISYIATDSHSLNTRPPELAQAMEIIRDKFGGEKCEEFIRNAEELI